MHGSNIDRCYRFCGHGGGRIYSGNNEGGSCNFKCIRAHCGAGANGLVNQCVKNCGFDFMTKI